MTCIKNLSLCIGQHNRRAFILTATDSAGDPIDLSSTQEITFVVATSVKGSILLTKTKTGGAITLGSENGTNDAVLFTITEAESGALNPMRLYCEIEITDSSGYTYTAGAGPFTVQDTIIGDA